MSLDIQKMAKIGILKGKNLKVRNGIDLITPAEGVSVIEDSSYTWDDMCVNSCLSKDGVNGLLVFKSNWVVYRQCSCGVDCYITLYFIDNFVSSNHSLMNSL